MENPVQPIVAHHSGLLAATPMHHKNPALAGFAGSGEHSYGFGHLLTQPLSLRAECSHVSQMEECHLADLVLKFHQFLNFL